MATNNGNNTNLGWNIRVMRKALGETQLDLAQAIGASGPNVISQYESGERMPERENLLKIAKHFKITENELLYSSFEQAESITNVPIGDPSFNMAMLERMFPLVCTNEALENQNFKRAYEMHTDLLSQLRQGQELKGETIDLCMELYGVAREEGLIEATANHLWWLMFLGFLTVILTPRMMAIFDVIDSGDLSIKDILNGLLPSFDEDSPEDEFDTDADRRDFLKENEQDIVIDIYCLRKSRAYSDLGDFYLALRHKYNLLSNNLSAEMNRAVGDELLSTFLLLGNKYCKDYLMPPTSIM